MIKKVVFLSVLLNVGAVVHPAAGPDHGAMGSKIVQEKCCKVCGKSQAQLAGGEKISSCKGCRALYYCSRACQKADWKDHKKTCARLNEAESCAYLAICDAICENNYGTVRLAVKKLRDEGGDLTRIFGVADEKGTTLLHAAALLGSKKIFSLLIKVAQDVGGVDIDQARSDGVTPLFMAAQNGHQSIVEYLVEGGANVNQVGIGGRTPLLQAAKNDHQAVVEFLVGAGANVNQATSDNDTPLSMAAENGHQAVVKFLVGARANVNKADIEGATPLYISAQNGHQDVVEYLVGVGADVDQAAINEITPLYIAAQKGHRGVVECLVENGADVNKAVRNISRPLNVATLMGHTTIAAYLREKGAVDVRPASDPNDGHPNCRAQ